MLRHDCDRPSCGWPEYAHFLADHLYFIEDQINEGFIMTQASIDAATAVLNGLATELDTIEAGIDSLKSQTDGTADTTALDAAVASLKGKVDAAVTDVEPASSEPVAPVTDPTPVVDAPADPSTDTPAT